MTIKRLAGAVLALATMGLGGLLLASPAQATDDDCKTVVSALVDRPDSAVGGGTWALDQLQRTVTVCQTDAGVYHAEVHDVGTFTTVELDHTPGGVDQPLPAGIDGTVEGGFTADFAAAADWVTFDGSHLDGVTIPWIGDGTDLSTGKWVASLFGGDIDGKSLNDDWSWVYRTWCGEEVQEQWINQTAALGGNQGDITEVPECPVPVPSVEFDDHCDGVLVHLTNGSDATADASFVVSGLDDGPYQLIPGHTPEPLLTGQTSVIVTEQVTGEEWTHEWAEPKGCEQDGESPAPGIAGGTDGGQLPVTGSPLPWIALGGVVLIVAGVGLYAVVGSRRRITFTP